MNNAFYIIWNPDSEKPPQKRYTDREKAQSVAETMARKFPGQTFHVLENQGAAVTQSVTWTPAGGRRF